MMICNNVNDLLNIIRSSLCGLMHQWSLIMSNHEKMLYPDNRIPPKWVQGITATGCSNKQHLLSEPSAYDVNPALLNY